MTEYQQQLMYRIDELSQPEIQHELVKELLGKLLLSALAGWSEARSRGLDISFNEVAQLIYNLGHDHGYKAGIEYMMRVRNEQ